MELWMWMKNYSCKVKDYLKKSRLCVWMEKINKRNHLKYPPFLLRTKHVFEEELLVFLPGEVLTEMETVSNDAKTNGVCFIFRCKLI